MGIVFIKAVVNFVLAIFLMLIGSLVTFHGIVKGERDGKYYPNFAKYVEKNWREADE